MANAKEIQDRMKSINDTLKITNAMYMISSSKLKKSKKMLTDTEPYFFTLQSEMSRILRHLPDLDSIYFRSTDEIPEEEKRIAYMVVTADKGLAGSYNHNILKIAEEELAKHPKRQLYVLGEVGRHYFEERGIEINKQFHYTIQNPTLNRARNISEELLEGYRQGDFDEIYIIYTSMVNAMQEEAEILQLLPLKKADFHNVEIPLDVRREELALRPSADAVMNRIVPDYVVGFVYGALVESFSCEQNARMMAMEAATNSAKDMLHELDIMYNRARQAAITQEITEVIAGAKSQKRKNTYHIIRKIQTQSQKFEISHKKLEHKVVLYILPAKMRILCREIVPHRKRPHHRCMRCIIPVNRITAVQHSVFDKKDVKHDPGQKDQ